MQIIKHGTEQFQMNVGGKEYATVNILSLEEFEEGGKHNSIVFLIQDIEIPETEYRGGGAGTLYYDLTENAYYAVREPVKKRYLFQISVDGDRCFDEEFEEISRKAAMLAIIEKYTYVHKISLLEE